MFLPRQATSSSTAATSVSSSTTPTNSSPRATSIPLSTSITPSTRTVITTPSPTTSSTLPSSSEPASNSQSNPMSMIIVVPVVVICGALLMVAILFALRRHFSVMAGRRPQNSPNRNTRSGSASTDRESITAEQLLSGHSATPRSRSASGGTLPLSGPASRGGNANANANGRGRRGPRGRHLRRTDSGNSVRTLPPYSKEAGDEELVLVRRTSMESLQEAEELASAAYQRENTPPDSPGGSPPGLEPQDIPLPISPISPINPSNPLRSAPLESDRRRTNSSGSAARRGWGQAPTYLEAMSSPSFDRDLRNGDIESGLGVPPPPRTPTPGATLRERTTSTFQNLFTRLGTGTSNNNRPPPTTLPMSQIYPPGSATSLLLNPQTSRNSGYSSPSPWASTHSLNISSPLPNSAVRASFDLSTMPRAGLSDLQMRYISSSEALQTAGISLADPPAGRRTRRGTGASSGDVPIIRAVGVETPLESGIATTPPVATSGRASPTPVMFQSQPLLSVDDLSASPRSSPRSGGRRS